MLSLELTTVVLTDSVSLICMTCEKFKYKENKKKFQAHYLV